MEYLDSMGKNGDIYLNAIKRWMIDDVRIRHKEEVDLSKWNFTNMGKKTPQQKNAYDCGVFAALNVQHDIEDLPLDYTQEDVNFFSMRKRMLNAILNETIGY